MALILYRRRADRDVATHRSETLLAIRWFSVYLGDVTVPLKRVDVVTTTDQRDVRLTALQPITPSKQTILPSTHRTLLFHRPPRPPPLHGSRATFQDPRSSAAQAKYCHFARANPAPVSLAPPHRISGFDEEWQHPSAIEAIRPRYRDVQRVDRADEGGFRTGIVQLQMGVIVVIVRAAAVVERESES